MPRKKTTRNMEKDIESESDSDSEYETEVVTIKERKTKNKKQPKIVISESESESESESSEEEIEQPKRKRRNKQQILEDEARKLITKTGKIDMRKHKKQVSEKQLEALARGRANRQANLLKKKQEDEENTKYDIEQKASEYLKIKKDKHDEEIERQSNYNNTKRKKINSEKQKTSTDNTLSILDKLLSGNEEDNKIELKEKYKQKYKKKYQSKKKPITYENDNDDVIAQFERKQVEKSFNSKFLDEPVPIRRSRFRY